jgi:DNA-binding response OmpR family regulator
VMERGAWQQIWKDDAFQNRPHLDTPQLEPEVAAPLATPEQSEQSEQPGRTDDALAMAELEAQVASLRTEAEDAAADDALLAEALSGLGEDAIPRTPGPLRILIAEDDRISNRVLTRHVEKAGHDVTSVADGQAAIDAITDGEFDIVLTDMQMPHASGLDVLVAARLHDHSIDVFLVSAVDSVHVAIDAMQAGARDYFPKPIEPELIKNTLADIALERNVAGAAPSTPAPASIAGGESDPNSEQPTTMADLEAQVARLRSEAEERALRNASLAGAMEDFEQEAPERRPGPLRVLIAEDDMLSNRVLTKHIQKGGHDVTSTKDGQEAIDAIRAGDFDVVLTDMQMPKANGLEVLAATRVHDSTIDVYLVTGVDSVHVAVDAIRAGARDYFPKPIEPDVIRKTLAGIAEERGATMPGSEEAEKPEPKPEPEAEVPTEPEPSPEAEPEPEPAPADSKPAASDAEPEDDA